MVWAMLDAALLLKQSFLWWLAAADSGHVPGWARTVAALEVTRKPIPNRARTLNIQVDPNSCNRGEHSHLPHTDPNHDRSRSVEPKQAACEGAMIQTDNSSVCVRFPCNESSAAQSADTAASYSCYTAFTAGSHSSLLPLSTCRVSVPEGGLALVIPVLSASTQYASQEETAEDSWCQCQQLFSFSVNFAF